MEHEDNYTMQNSQNLMDNVQIASGGVCGDNGGLVATEDIVGGICIGSSNIGGKFEQHEDHDDDGEWKYIKEVQQSEKPHYKAEDKDVFAAAKDGSSNGNGNGYDFGNSAGFGDDFMSRQQQHADHEFGNGHVDVETINAAAVAAAATAGAMDDEEMGLIRNECDFSTTSNTISTPGDDDVAADVLQVEMKIEPQLLQQHEELQQLDDGARDEMEEEEPSSLATTNGTSSLSENPMQQMLQQQNEEEEQLQQQQQQKEYAMVDQGDVIGDKENVDPDIVSDENARPTNLDVEPHSQLNPDAKEFVPNFNSPTSPVSPSPFIAENVGEPADGEPHPSALPRRIWSSGDDDFIAQSPRKGGDVDMEQISLPAECDFDNEAAKRPHELEKADDLIGEYVAEEEKVVIESAVDAIEGDNVDFQSHSPSSFVDHGPETCVDLDTDMDMQQPPEIMKTSMYVEPTEPHAIEDILNSVQPLPTEFIEDDQKNDKESLSVEEKENISQSPSTEEMQMNLRNQYYENRDINAPQAPIDMDSAAVLEESFYVENTTNDVITCSPQLQFEESLLVNTSSPLETSDTALIDTSIEVMRERTPTPGENQAEMVAPGEPLQTLQFSGQHDDEHHPLDDATPSPVSTEEKHLVEETKEQVTSEAIDDLEHKMDQLSLSHDGYLSQQPIEEVAQDAATIPTATDDTLLVSPDALEQQLPADALEQQLPADALEQTPELPPASQVLEPMEEHFEQIVQDNEQILMEAPHQDQTESEHVQQSESELVQQLEPEQVRQPVDTLEPELAAPKVELAPEEPAGVVESTEVAPIETPIVAAEVDVTPPVAEVLAAAAAAATVAAAAASATTKPATDKKVETPKKQTSSTSRTSIASKPKVGDAKKPVEAKKSTGAMAPKAPTTTGAARPRTAPAKPATTIAEKKSTTTIASRPATATATTARKPLAAATKSTSLAKTTTAAGNRTTTATTAGAPKSTLSARTTRVTTSSTGTARKSPTASLTTTAAATKAPRTSAGTGEPAPKPTSLGVSGAAKPKLTSPRATLASQLRKAAPSVGAKSPTKSSTSIGALSARSTTSSTAPGNRLRSSASAMTTTTTTKTFVARPAPKTTSTVSMTSTTSRRIVGTTASASQVTTTTTTTTTTSKRASTGMVRKSSPTKPGSGTTSAGKLSPTKSAASVKSKTKEATKSPATKTESNAVPKSNLSAEKLKQQQQQDGNESKLKSNGVEAPGEPQLNGDAQQVIATDANGIGEHFPGENGMMPEQQNAVEASLIDV